MTLAELKAEAVAKKYSEGVIVGFDSVGWFNGLILEKPNSTEEAFSRLRCLSGKNHELITGVYMRDLRNGNSAIRKVVTTVASMRELTDQEIIFYLNQYPDFKNRAMGYDPLEGFSMSFIDRIEGSYNNLLRGVPIECVVEMLHELGEFNLVVNKA